MANETTLTIVGNLGNDVELRFTPSGSAVASFTIASTPRHFDKRTNEWVNDETLWMRCTAWRDLAEHIAETLRKGMRVIAQGRLTQRSYQDRNGVDRTVVELTVDEIGPSLRYATAQVTRTLKNNPQGGYNAQGQAASATTGNQAGQGWNAPQGGSQDDPWATGGTTDFGQEPPF